MKLPFKRSKPKKAQALDVLASVASIWSDLHLSKRAGKGVKKGRKKASSATSAVGSKARRTPAKVAGALALLGGAGAVIARKLKGGGSEPLPYVPPEAPPYVPPEPPPVPAAALPSDPADSAPLGGALTDPVSEEVPAVGEALLADEPAGEQPATEGPGADEFTGDQPD